MKRYLLASDFDQTLSFNDSGIVLSELLDISDFREKTAGLSRIHLVQQGAELAYLLLHDPEYRRVRKEHLVEVGKRVRLKQNLSLLPRLLGELDGYDFAFYVISAAPQTGRGSITTPPPARSSRSSASRPDTARWPCSKSSGRSCRWATTG